MSTIAAERTASPPSERPGLRARIGAVAVVIALALLAAYTVFSGPTKVPIKAPHERADPHRPAGGGAGARERRSEPR